MAKKYFWVMIVSLLVFILLALDVLFFHTLQNFDVLVNNFFASIRTPPITSFMKILSDFGEPLFLGIASAIILSVLLFKKRFRESLIFGLAMGGGILINSAMKIFIHRARPENIIVSESSSSFPSSHAVMTLIFFSLLIYFFILKIKNKPIKITLSILCLIAVLLIGISRLYLGAHWFSDVIAGWAFGIFWVGLVLFFMNKKKG